MYLFRFKLFVQRRRRYCICGDFQISFIIVKEFGPIHIFCMTIPSFYPCQVTITYYISSFLLVWCCTIVVDLMRCWLVWFVVDSNRICSFVVVHPMIRPYPQLLQNNNNFQGQSTYCFSNNLNSQLIHKKGYFSIHSMALIALARYNFTTITIEAASWSKFVDGYVQGLFLFQT
jgi:hypothetical protein